MIGNDIVDLSLAEKESNWQRKGFLEKQFTKKEQQGILSSEDPFFTVWLFWSMKEAAYKCYTQKVEKRFFAPQKFSCSLISQEEGTVTFNAETFYTSSTVNKSYIHTIAKDEVSNTSTKTIFLGMSPPNVLDRDFTNHISKESGILASIIEKTRTKFGIPNFYVANKKLTSSCTISHHGNYGAYAFML